MSKQRVIIVGGGASGIFAAIACAEANPDCQVTVLERGKELLSKVKISGGGRCNVTHACFEPNELIKHYPRGHLELRGPLHRWNPQNTIDWFESRDVPLKTEKDGRIFPQSDDSQTIIDCLLQAAKEANVKIVTQCGLLDLQAKPQGAGFWLTITGEETIECEKLIIAAGSLRSSKAAAISRNLGHTVEQLVPSLFTFHIDDARINNLPGISVEHVVATLPHTSLQSEGPILITHWGLSGPAILKLSAWGARELHQVGYQFKVIIDWLPKKKGKSTTHRLNEAKKQFSKRHVKNGAHFPLPQRLWESLVTAAGITQDDVWATLSNEKIQALARELNHCMLKVERKSMNKEEFVTCGGISLKEIHFKTMESKIVPSLYYVGEALNIDGVTGGFNFQAAWTTGYIAGNAAAETLNTEGTFLA